MSLPPVHPNGPIFSVPRPLAMRYSSEPYGKSPDNMTWTNGQINTKVRTQSWGGYLFCYPGWWLNQPHPEKYACQIGFVFPNFRDENKKYLKTTTSYHILQSPTHVRFWGTQQKKCHAFPFYEDFRLIDQLSKLEVVVGKRFVEKSPGNPERGPYGWYVAESTTTHPKVSSCPEKVLTVL